MSAQIVTYPTYGFQTDAKGWRINVAGIAFQSPPFTLRQRMLIKMLGKTMKVDEQTLRGEIFQNRVSPFFVEAEKGLEIRVTVEETTRTLRKRSRKNGHFADSPRFPASVIERAAETDEFGRKCVPYTIEVADRSAEVVRGIAHLIPRYGVSVISDIDDTIKESQVTDRRELLFNTFLRDFRSVSGMADVYQGWQANGADFHYVSSSPWQLFDSLQRHQTENGFPTGTMHLRNFRLRDQLLKPLPIVRRRGKATAIRKMLKDLPDRKFILVGDSGEKDPEIYLKMCRRHPGQIAGVFIREIQERPMVEERVRKLHREAKGFICSVFSEPQTLANNASQIFDKLPPAI